MGLRTQIAVGKESCVGIEAMQIEGREGRGGVDGLSWLSRLCR